MAGDYDGFSFGRSIRVTMITHPSAAQVNEFFGVTGRQRLWGGGRGRIFVVEALFFGANRAAVDALRNTLLSYDDGIGRVLTDTGGTAWPAVVFTGQYNPTGGYVYGHGGLLLPYRAHFEGML